MEDTGEGHGKLGCDHVLLIITVALSSKDDVRLHSCPEADAVTFALLKCNTHDMDIIELRVIRVWNDSRGQVEPLPILIDVGF